MKQSHPHVIRKVLAPVLSVEKLAAPGHFVLTFEAPDLAREARPGQFVTVAAETGTQFLRRPFSVYTADPERGVASILFSMYGPTTRAMAGYGPGDRIDLIGPLGGKVFAADARPGVRHVMVGGGYGVPPLAFLSRRILASDPTADVVVVNGARTRDFLVGTDGLDGLGATLYPCTDDGSCGYHGRVTGLLAELLSDKARPVHVYTCGPTPMMKAVAQMSMEFGVPCQASMEVFMPCGIGICMGCAVPRPDGTFARGCVEGPVFEAREIVW